MLYTRNRSRGKIGNKRKSYTQRPSKRLALTFSLLLGHSVLGLVGIKSELASSEHRKVTVCLALCTFLASDAAMVFIHSWQEFQDAAEALYAKSPTKVLSILVQKPHLTIRRHDTA
jgi:hypothetical protein